jgi:selenophosphate synthase
MNKTNYLLDIVNDILVCKLVAILIFNMKNCKHCKEIIRKIKGK